MVAYFEMHGGVFSDEVVQTGRTQQGMRVCKCIADVSGIVVVCRCINGCAKDTGRTNHNNIRWGNFPHIWCVNMFPPCGDATGKQILFLQRWNRPLFFGCWSWVCSPVSIARVCVSLSADQCNILFLLPHYLSPSQLNDLLFSVCCNSGCVRFCGSICFLLAAT